MDDDDSLLLRAVAAGAHAALDALYTRHARAAYALACWIVGDQTLAEDVVQDAFLAVWRQAERFDPARGTAHAWICAIVRHRAIDALRRLRSQITTSGEGAIEREVDGQADVEGEVTLSVEGARVRAAMLTLPPTQRHAVELAYFGGLTHHEIAAHLDLPLGTVKGRLRLALRKLYNLLGEEYGLAAAAS